MTRQNVFNRLVSVVFITALPAAAGAGITLRLPDITVRPGQSGTFDAMIEFNGTPPPPPPFYPPGATGFRVWGLDVRVVADPGSAGFRMPSVAGGLLGAGIVTETENAVATSNGVYCLAIFPPTAGCPPAYSNGPHLLLRPDFQINPNVTPGTQYSLSFDLSKTQVIAYNGQPYAIDGVVGGSVNVVESPVPILGGPVGPHDFPGNVLVEDFNLGLTSPVPVPLTVANAVITTSNGADLNFRASGSDITFGPAIAQRHSGSKIIADFTVDTLRAGAWVGGPSNKGITAEFFAGDTSLGSTTVHSLFSAPVFIGFESHAGYITRAVFSGIGTGTAFTLDSLTTDAQPGDFNADGNVDTADYTLWRNLLGQIGGGLAADALGPGGMPDGIVDMLDYAVWQSNYGSSASARAAAMVAGFGQTVPEPSSLVVAVLGALLAIFRRLGR